LLQKNVIQCHIYFYITTIAPWYILPCLGHVSLSTIKLIYKTKDFAKDFYTLNTTRFSILHFACPRGTWHRWTIINFMNETSNFIRAQGTPKITDYLLVYNFWSFLFDIDTSNKTEWWPDTNHYVVNILVGIRPPSCFIIMLWLRHEFNLNSHLFRY